MITNNLNDKYGIPFGSEWEHKDSGKYMAFDVVEIYVTEDKTIPIVIYKKMFQDEKEIRIFFEQNTSNEFVRTVEHFKNSFKILKD